MLRGEIYLNVTRFGETASEGGAGGGAQQTAWSALVVPNSMRLARWRDSGMFGGKERVLVGKSEGKIPLGIPRR